MHVHALHTFTHVSAASAASPAPTQPSIKESTKGGRPPKAAAPFVEAATPLWMVVSGLWRQQTAETHVNVRKTCTCMHTRRATSDPQGHHGRAQPAGGRTRFFGCCGNIKKGAQRPCDLFPGSIALRSLLCVRKRRTSFSSNLIYLGAYRRPTTNNRPRRLTTCPR